MIDHIVATPGFKDLEIKDSTFALYCEPWISGFGNNTSDHYPISSKLKWPSNKAALFIQPTFKDSGPLRFIDGSLFLGKELVTSEWFSISNISGQKVEINSITKDQWYILNRKERETRVLFMLGSNGLISYR
jgi:hypothetical protein